MSTFAEYATAVCTASILINSSRCRRRLFDTRAICYRSIYIIIYKHIYRGRHTLNGRVFMHSM